MGVLHLFHKTFAAGGTRLKACATFLRKAWKGGLVPHMAHAVDEGVLAKPRSVERETAMERQTMVEESFDDLSPGRMSHSTSQAKWEHLLVGMEGAGIDPLSDKTPFRRYLSNTLPDLNHAVLSHMWALDPCGTPRSVLQGGHHAQPQALWPSPIPCSRGGSGETIAERFGLLATPWVLRRI